MAGKARRGLAESGVDKQGAAMNGRRLEELRTIERNGGGILHPEAVVEFAKNPATALHSAFEWDNTEAARQWRIQQARQLIRVVCEYTPHSTEPVKAFVALKADRYEDGGYRYMPTLLRSKDGRDAVLKTALWELEAFQKKYQELEELAEVFAAIRKVKKVAA